LEQLRDITAVCKKHNISYNMMCGSLLGAVRHKGFIPWDDDVDLLMTREEFQKFREIYPKECDKRFELMYLETWTPRVMNRDPEKAAAFTDFFILDPVPPEGFQRKWWFFKLHTLQGMLKKKGSCNPHRRGWSIPRPISRESARRCLQRGRQSSLDSAREFLP